MSHADRQDALYLAVLAVAGLVLLVTWPARRFYRWTQGGAR